MIKKYMVLLALGAFVFAQSSFVLAEDKNAKGSDEVKSEEVAKEDKKEQKAEKKAEKDPLLEAQEKSVKRSRGLLSKLMKDLSFEEKKHFMRSYSNYNLISTTEVVRADVKKAIQNCGENNPDMKEELDTRFEAWDVELKPLIKEAEDNLDNMVVAQDYAKKRDIEKIFDSLDDTREKTNARFEKIPVTTPEACEFLLGKMDETQANLISLLRSTLASFAQVSPDIELEEEGAEEADSEKKSDDKKPKDL